jgi:S1-C subfamily serine protease
MEMKNCCEEAPLAANSGEGAGAGPEIAVAKSRPVSFCGFDPASGPNAGLLVASADPASSAAQAGIAVGDEILAIDGARVKEPAGAMALLQAAGVGATVCIELVRSGAELRVPMQVLAKSLVLELDDLDEVVERKIAPAAS